MAERKYVELCSSSAMMSIDISSGNQRSFVPLKFVALLEWTALFRHLDLEFLKCDLVNLHLRSLLAALSYLVQLFSSLEYKGLETSDDAEENQEEAAFEPRSASAMSPAGATGSKKKRKKKKKGKSGSQPSAVAEDDNADDSKEKEEETDEQKESLAKEVSESAVVKGDNATVAQHEVSPQTNLDVKEKENSASDATQVKMAIDDGGSKVESTAKGQNDGQTPDGPKTTLSDIQDTKLEQNEESESAHQKMTETQNPTEKLIETWKPEEKEQVDVVKDTTTSMNIGDESKGALSDGTLPLVDAEQVKEDPDKEKETEAGDTTQVESFVVDVPQQGNQKPAKVDDKVSDEEKVSKDEDISNTTGMIPSKNASTDTMLSDSRLKKATATDVVIKPDQHKDNSNNPKVSSAPSQETNLAAPLNYLADSAKAWTPVLSKPEGSDVNVPVGAKIFPYEELKREYYT